MARADQIFRAQLGRQLLGSLCFLAVLGVGLGCQSDEEKIAEFMSRGEAYSEEGKHNEASIEFRNVLKLDPNNARAHHELAKSYLRVEKIREGYWELNETVRLDPTNVDARLSFGQMSAAARDFEESLAQAEAALEIQPENTRAVVLKAQSLEALERVEDAEEWYLRALEVGLDEEPGFLVVVADYYERRSDRVKAEPYLQQFIELEPGFTSYSTLARFTVEERDRDDETEAHFRKAVELSDAVQLPTAYRNLAGFLFARNRMQEAAAVLQEGIEASEEKLDLIYLLARFRLSEGQTEEADALMAAAAAARPDDVQPLLVLSAYRGRQGDLDGALAAAEQAIALDPSDQKSRLRKAELLVDKGFRESNDGLINEGRAIVLEVLEEEPSSPDGLFVHAKIQLAEGDRDGAIKSLRSAIDGRPDWPQAHFVLGSALALKGDNSAARVELARAVELDAGLSEARRLLARVHASLGEHEYAIEQGRFYLRERPDHVESRILVAQSLVRIGKIDEAYEELQAIPDEHLDSASLYAIGRLHMARGEFEKAHGYLVRADAAEPHSAEILASLLRIDLNLRRLDESVARIAAAAAERPEDARIVQLQGEVALSQGDVAAAEKAFVRATELDPDDLRAYQRLAVFYRRQGRLQETIATYERAVASRPDAAQMHHFLATLYEANGDRQDAIDHYEKAIELDATLGEARNNLAYLLAEDEDTLDRALDLAQEAKALMPDSPNASDTLGWVLYRRGIASAAVGYLREAEAGMDPGDPNLGIIRWHLAQAYEANGEPDKAIASIDRALLAQTDGAPDASWMADARAMRRRLQSS